MPKVEQFNKEIALESALNLFWEKGYNGTSIRDLETAMHLGRSSIYNTFGDKDALFFAVLKHYMNTEQARIGGRIATAGSALNALRQVLDCVINPPRFGKLAINGCLLVNCVAELADTHPAVRQFADDAKENTLQLLKVLMTKAQEQGDISASKDPGDLALYFFSNMQGLKLTGMLTKSPKELLPVVGAIIKTLTCV
jgi:TetR/AcrR family transcriptional repressor of nem operon